MSSSTATAEYKIYTTPYNLSTNTNTSSNISNCKCACNHVQNDLLKLQQCFFKLESQIVELGNKMIQLESSSSNAASLAAAAYSASSASSSASANSSQSSSTSQQQQQPLVLVVPQHQSGVSGAGGGASQQLMLSTDQLLGLTQQIGLLQGRMDHGGAGANTTTLNYIQNHEDNVGGNAGGAGAGSGAGGAGAVHWYMNQDPSLDQLDHPEELLLGGGQFDLQEQTVTTANATNMMMGHQELEMHSAGGGGGSSVRGGRGMGTGRGGGRGSRGANRPRGSRGGGVTSSRGGGGGERGGGGFKRKRGDSGGRGGGGLSRISVIHNTSLGGGRGGGLGPSGGRSSISPFGSSISSNNSTSTSLTSPSSSSATTTATGTTTSPSAGGIRIFEDKLGNPIQCVINSAGQYKCPLCSNVRKNKQSLKYHYNEKHVDASLHKCGYCNKILKVLNESTISEHVQSCHEHDEHCGHLQPGRQLLVGGMQAEPSIALYSCKFCTKSFDRVDKLSKHMSDKHPGVSAGGAGAGGRGGGGGGSQNPKIEVVEEEQVQMDLH